MIPSSQKNCSNVFRWTTCPLVTNLYFTVKALCLSLTVCGRVRRIVDRVRKALEVDNATLLADSIEAALLEWNAEEVAFAEAKKHAQDAKKEGDKKKEGEEEEEGEKENEGAEKEIQAEAKEAKVVDESEQKKEDEGPKTDESEPKQDADTPKNEEKEKDQEAAKEASKVEKEDDVKTSRVAQLSRLLHTAAFCAAPKCVSLVSPPSS